ncbi:hypothetical protein WA026_008106, partial [Henosepilachna vigintioctopunctata]
LIRPVVLYGSDTWIRRPEEIKVIVEDQEFNKVIRLCRLGHLMRISDERTIKLIIVIDLIATLKNARRIKRWYKEAQRPAVHSAVTLQHPVCGSPHVWVVFYGQF